MVAIVSGMRAGLELSSRAVLGPAGQVGNAAEGRNGEGVYVNVATGNLVVQNQDELLVAHGEDAVTLRTYNSLGQFSDDNGDRWRTGTASLQLAGVVNTLGSTITRTAQDGSSAVYTFDGAGYVTTEGAGAYDAIRYIAAEAQFEWTDGSTQTTQRYEGSGAMRLLSCRDTSGNVLGYAYNASGFLASVTTASGEKTTYDYAGANLMQVSTTTGATTTTRVRYAYDVGNRLASVTVDLSPPGSVTGRTYQTFYSYDGDSRRIASITQSDGTSLAFAYVDTGNGNFKVASVRDALGQTTSFTYGAGFATVTDALGLVTRYDFDAVGQLTKITAPAVGGVTPVQQFGYNERGDVTSITDGQGRSVWFEYSNGNQVLQRDAAGNTVRRLFDAGNRLLTETVYATPDPDGAGIAEPSIPLTTRYNYDSRGRLRFALSAEGRVTEHRYENAFGERSSTIAYAAERYPVAMWGRDGAPNEADMMAWVVQQNPATTQRVDMAYDGRGQLLTLTTYASVGATGAGIADGTHSVQTYVRDAAGRLLKTVSSTGAVTTYAYDGLGRVLSTTDAAGALTLTQYSDGAGKTAVTLANGLLRTSVYDKAGRLVSVAESNPAGALLGETRYFYDADNRLYLTQDPTGIRHWVLYDAAGRKAADVNGDATMTEYAYDASGRLTYSVTYATAVNLAAMGGSFGLPVPGVAVATVRPATSIADRREWRSYDTAGRLLRTATSYGTGTTAAVTENRYDGASRLVQVVRYANPLATDTPAVAPGLIAAPAASADDRISRSFYDAEGLLTGSLDAEGYLAVFNYTGAGQLAETIRYATATNATLRAAGTLAQLTPAAAAGDARTVNLYDGKGQRVGTVDAEGYLTEFVHDNHGNVTKSVRYANRVTVPVTARSTLGELRVAGSPGQAITRTFDAFDRLLSETSAEGVRTEYRYDTMGNLVSTVRAAATEEARALLSRYDLQGRLVAELSATGAALLTAGQTSEQVEAIWARYATRHTYDAAGRLASTTDAAGNRTLFWYNGEGAVIMTINALGEVQENGYDGRGRLVEQYGSPVRINSAGLEGGLGTVALGNAVGALAGRRELLVRYTYTSDGRIASSADAAGNITRTTYNAFGDEVAIVEDTGQWLLLSKAFTVDRRGLRTSSAEDAANTYLARALSSTSYDAFGRAVRTVDANGNVREQSFDRLGRVVATRNALDARRSTSYDAFDRVLTETDALGKVTSYAYDAATRSFTVTTPEGIRTTTTTTRHGQVQSVTDGKGQTSTYAYDRDGNLVRTTTPLTTTSASFDAAGRMMESVDANGVRTASTYDAANRVLTRRVDPTGLNLTTTYQYDGMGRQVAVTDPNGVITTRQFDSRGRVLRETVDPSGLKLETVYTYNPRGQVLTVTRPGGTVTEYVYDVRGRLGQEHVDPTGLRLTRTWIYDRNDNVVASTDAAGNMTRYVYDAENRLIFTIDAAGGMRQNVYDAAGRVVMTVASRAATSTGAIPAEVTPALAIQLINAQPAMNLVEHRVYDGDGRLAATVDAAGGVVKYSYDANGNVVARTAYVNPVSLTTWVRGSIPMPVADPTRDATVRTAYDSLNRAVFTVDGIGAVVAQSYDGNGNVLQRTGYANPVPAGTPATQQALAAAVGASPGRDAVVRNTYDAANRLTWSVDGTGAVTQRMYDGNGNVVRQVAYATAVAATASASLVTASAADRSTVMAYDNANRLVLTVDALRGVAEQVYDANGRIVRRVEYATPLGSVPAPGSPGTAAAIRSLLAPDAAADRTTRYGYDAAGRQTLVIDAVGAVTERQFDGADRVTAEIGYADLVNAAMLPGVPTLAAMKALVPPGAAVGRAIRTAYDAAGRVAYTVDPIGAVTGYQYDGVGQLTRTTRHAVLFTGPFVNTVGGIAEALRPGLADQVESHLYNAAGQRIATSDALGSFEWYGYDALGRRLTFTNKVGVTWTYAYDAAGRMVSETSPEVKLAKYTTNAAGVATGAFLEAGTVITRLSYDALGNLTQRIEAAGRFEQRITRYEYDALGRQVRVIHPAAANYDPAADAPTYNGAIGIAARTETQPVGLETRTFYDALGNAVASIDVGGAVSQKAYDLLGRVSYDVDALGYVTGYTRNTFGEVTRLVRYAAATALGNASVSSASQAAGKAQVEAALYAVGANTGRERTLDTRYDRAGRAIETTESAVFSYDSSADLASQGSYSPPVTRNTYDSLGRLVRVDRLRNALTGAWVTTLHKFDAAGREVATIDAAGYLTEREFDGYGNMVRQTEYATALAQVSPGYVTPAGSQDDRTTRYTYDALNRKITETRQQVEYSNVADGASYRRDMTTLFGYDRLGNQTSVTDPLGNVTRTDYDVLGRASMVWAPARNSTVDGGMLTPVTEFRRDAYGNVVLRMEYARFELGATADDHKTFSAYDGLGRVTHTIDANDATEYFSYDAYGHVAKRWRGVTGNDAKTRTTFELNEYDKLGQLVTTYTPASTSVYSAATGLTVVSQAAIGVVASNRAYNAFGEMVQKGIQWGAQEYFEYDNAGRLWRTNSVDGVDRVYLYDALSNNTAEIRSRGAGYGDLDVRSFINPDAAFATAGTRRVDMEYDALGRMTTRKEAERSEDQGGVTLSRQSPLAIVTGSATAPGMLNSVLVSFKPMGGLGIGDVKAVIQYRSATAGTLRSYSSGVFTGQAVAGALSLQWTEMNWSDVGVGTVTRIQVFKKDVNGTWQAVIDQAPGGSSPEILLAAPPKPGTVTVLKLRVAGTLGDAGWWYAGLVDFGNQLRYDARGLAPGTYEYVVSLMPGSEDPRVTAWGTVTIGSSVLVDAQNRALDGDSRALRPIVTQKFDRWGNVIEATDPRSKYWKTTYRFNFNNQLVQQVQPEASGLPNAPGAVTSIFYDWLGRQIAVKDANGIINGQVFDAGGNLVKELHADGGVLTHSYDAFGRKVRTVDAEGRVISYAYDKMGRLLNVRKGLERVYLGNVGGYIGWASTRDIMERWTYDELGRKLTQTNGNDEQVKYTYDLVGNLIETRQPMGEVVSAAYDTQGRKIAERDPNGLTARWEYSYFGQLRRRYELSGLVHEYTHDRAGQLLKEATGLGQTITYYYDAAGQLTTIGDWNNGKTTTYRYDLSGRRVRETVAQGIFTYQDNHLAYDALGRLRDVADARAHVMMEYDAVGNRTRVYSSVDYQGTSGETGEISDRYFKYDAMNRQIVVDAVDRAGSLGSSGHELTYDRNGNRTRDRYLGNTVVATPVFDNDENGIPFLLKTVYTPSPAYTIEEYAYDSRDRLTSVTKDGVVIDRRYYDGADRLMQSGSQGNLATAYTEALNAGLPVDKKVDTETHVYRYDANGKLLNQRILKSDGKLKADMSWEAGVLYDDGLSRMAADGYDPAGNSRGYVIKDYESGALTRYSNDVLPGDGYFTSTIKGESTRQGAGYSRQQRDLNGYLVGITDDLQPKNNRTFVNDANGRALLVNQAGYVRRQLIVNGEVLGIYGVGVNPADPVSGPKGNPNFADLADFNFTFSRVSGTYPSPGPGAYTVNAGDTLQSIAQSAFGDSALWYRIAEANGLRSSSDMRIGQTLNIPNRVATIHNDSTTFKPYDPSRVEGDKTPTLVSPEKKGGCGGVGLVLMAAIAVIATIYTAGAVTSAMGTVTASTGTAGAFSTGVAALAGGSATVGGVGITIGAGAVFSGGAAAVAGAAIGAAVGSMASQAFGIAVGIQDGFNWKGVALSALSAGAGSGIGAAGILAEGTPMAIAGRQVLGNLVTQGVGVAVGLQKRFDWRGVAAAGAGSLAGQAVGSIVGIPGGGPLGEFVNRAASSFAAGATVQLMRGGRVTLQQVAMDAFGNALGSSLADVMNPQPSPYSLATGDSGVGLRPAGGSGTGLTYGGYRASAAPDGDGQYGQDRLTPDMDEGTVRALRENLGLRDPVSDEGWVLAAGPGQYGRSLGGYGPAFQTRRAPMSLDEFRRQEIEQRNTSAPLQDDLVPAASSGSGSISASPSWLNRMSSLAGAAWNGKISWSDAAAWAWSDEGRTRANGALQAAGGTVEAWIGAGLFVGPLAPVGIAMTLHGADNAAAGLETAATGTRQSTSLVEGLKYAGMDAGTAEFVNGGLGFLAGVAALGSPNSPLGLKPYSRPLEIRNGYIYRFDDAADRVSSVAGELTSNPYQVRNAQAQLSAGGKYRLLTDDGGHFVARRFDGPLDDFNHFAQDANFNRGAYRVLENSWQRALDAGKSVSVDIRPSYIGSSPRPAELGVRYTIDGVPYSKSFLNRRGGY